MENLRCSACSEGLARNQGVCKAMKRVVCAVQGGTIAQSAAT
ncbi:hypothetical protein XHC_3107 [Xanthomonas hortorum pv. carotae str. M081]|nr:hypothetical protein XHC_3107 [Xanthomonas hortorum pv. carotae str. M081]